MDPQTGYGTQIFQQSWMGNNGQTYGVFLCKGFYKLISRHWIYDATTPTGGAIDFKYGLSPRGNGFLIPTYKTLSTVTGCTFTDPVAGTDAMQNPVFSVPASKKMFLSAWVRETCGDAANGIPCKEHTYTHSQMQVKFPSSPAQNVTMNPAGPIIDGWQRIEGEFATPAAGNNIMELHLKNSSGQPVYFDDIRIHPYNANMKSYVYDPVNLRLTAELDPNNYATFYEYDEEGTLIRKKIETKEGIKTVTETRSALQKSVQ
jgi:hypothetical protein